MSRRTLSNIAATPLPRHLLPLVAVAGVLGAVAVATRPQSSVATPGAIATPAPPTAPAPFGPRGHAHEVLASVELATLRVDWISNDCPLLLAVYDRDGRAIGLYEHLEHAMASHPEVHAAFILGAFAGLPLGEADL